MESSSLIWLLISLSLKITKLRSPPVSPSYRQQVRVGLPETRVSSFCSSILIPLNFFFRNRSLCVDFCWRKGIELKNQEESKFLHSWEKFWRLNLNQWVSLRFSHASSLNFSQFSATVFFFQRCYYIDENSVNFHWISDSQWFKFSVLALSYEISWLSQKRT